MAHGGFLYRKDKAKLNTVNWRCSVHSCKGRLITPILDPRPEVQEDINPIEKGEHNHPPDPAGITVKKLQDRVKTAAVTTNDPPRRIVQDAIGTVGEEAAVKVRSNANLATMVNRKRRHQEAFAPIPQERQGFLVPPALKVTTTGVDFLLYDSGVDDHQRILIFGTHGMTDLMKDNRNWFIDGTFKVSPEIYYQLFTLHVLIGDTTIPCLYVLLPDKRRATYDRMWEAIINTIGDLLPESIMSDFEQASLQAVRARFPACVVKGCLFHLGQSIWRKIQAEGMRELYMNDEESRIKIKMLLALTFLPPDEVVEAFEELQEETHDNLAPIIDYFEDVYIGRPGRRRRAPLFPPQMWNMHDRTMDGLPRTNNAVEAWHRAFQSSLQCSHPTLWKFVQALKKEQGYQESIRAQAIAGGIPIPQKKKYVALNRRLQRLMQRRREMPRLQFLRGCAHNLELNV